MSSHGSQKPEDIPAGTAIPPPPPPPPAAAALALQKSEAPNVPADKMEDIEEVQDPVEVKRETTDTVPQQLKFTEDDTRQEMDENAKALYPPWISCDDYTENAHTLNMRQIHESYRGHDELEFKHGQKSLNTPFNTRLVFNAHGVSDWHKGSLFVGHPTFSKTGSKKGTGANVQMAFHLDTQAPHIEIRFRMERSSHKSTAASDLRTIRYRVYPQSIAEGLDHEPLFVREASGELSPDTMKVCEGDKTLEPWITQQRLFATSVALDKVRPVWTGISRHQIDAIKRRVKQGGERQEAYQLITALDDAFGFHAFCGWYPAEKETVEERFAVVKDYLDYFKNLLWVNMTLGTHWFYKQQLPPGETFANCSMDTLRTIEVPRWLGRKWEYEAGKDDQPVPGSLKLAEHNSLPLLYGFPEPAEVKFMIDLGIVREHMYSIEQYKLLISSNNAKIRARFLEQSVSGKVAQYLILVNTGDVDMNKKASEKVRAPDSGTRVTISFRLDPGQKSPFKMKGEVVDNPVKREKQSLDLCVWVRSATPRAVDTKAWYDVKLAIDADDVPAQRSLVASKLALAGVRGRSIGIDLRHVLYNSKRTIEDRYDLLNVLMSKTLTEPTGARINGLDLYRKVLAQGVPTLNELQRQFSDLNLENQTNCLLLHGPPGTGKSTTAMGIAVAMAATGLKVMVTAGQNSAVDGALSKAETIIDRFAVNEGYEVLQPHEFVRMDSTVAHLGQIGADVDYSGDVLDMGDVKSSLHEVEEGSENGEIVEKKQPAASEGSDYQSATEEPIEAKTPRVDPEQSEELPDAPRKNAEDPEELEDAPDAPPEDEESMDLDSAAPSLNKGKQRADNEQSDEEALAGYRSLMRQLRIDGELHPQGFACQLFDRIEYWAANPGSRFPHKLANRYLEAQIQASTENLLTMDFEGRRRVQKQLEYLEGSLAKWFLRNEVKIVFCTCSTAPHKALKAHWEPDVIIVEEAAMSGPADVITPLAAYQESVKQVILSGDYLQLKPVYTSRSKNEAQRYMQDSIFEKLCKEARETGAWDYVMLKVQHRMHRHLSKFVSEIFYEGELEDGDSLDSQDSPTQRAIEQFWSGKLGVDGAKWWNGRRRIAVDISSNAAKSEPFEQTTSMVNYEEAKEVVQLVMDMLAFEPQGDLSTVRRIRPEDIVIITPYKGQREAIRRLLFEQQERFDAMKARNWHIDPTEVAVNLKTINQIQGDEGNVVLTSYVTNEGYKGMVNEPDFKLGWISQKQQLCVGLSRARHCLVLFGAFKHFTNMVQSKHAAMTDANGGYAFRKLTDDLWKMGDIIGQAAWDWTKKTADERANTSAKPTQVFKKYPWQGTEHDEFMGIQKGGLTGGKQAQSGKKRQGDQHPQAPNAKLHGNNPPSKPKKHGGGGSSKATGSGSK